MITLGMPAVGQGYMVFPVEVPLAVQFLPSEAQSFFPSAPLCTEAVGHLSVF